MRVYFCALAHLLALRMSMQEKIPASKFVESAISAIGKGRTFERNILRGRGRQFMRQRQPHRHRRRSVRLRERPSRVYAVPERGLHLGGRHGPLLARPLRRPLRGLLPGMPDCDNILLGEPPKNLGAP